MRMGEIPIRRERGEGVRLEWRGDGAKISRDDDDKHISPVDRQAYDALGMLHLNPQVPKYGGFAPARQVFGRNP